MELRRPEPGKTTILISECSIFALIWTISLWPSAATVLWRWCMCLCENGHNLLAYWVLGGHYQKPDTIHCDTVAVSEA